VTSWTGDGKVAEMQRTDSGLGVTESYLYTYLAAPDPNAGLSATIILRRQVNHGSWTTVRQVAYDYYDGTVVVNSVRWTKLPEGSGCLRCGGMSMGTGRDGTASAVGDGHEFVEYGFSGSG
jgi:hypothetical protein